MASESNDGNSQIPLSIWKTVVEVQQHFNDLCLKIRSLVITAVAAFVAGIGFSVKEGLTIFSDAVPLSSMLAVAAALFIFFFYMMDRYWYHQFLVGAVKYGEAIETKHPEIFCFGEGENELGLGRSISHESPIRLEMFGNQKIIRSSQKFSYFYLGMAGLFVFLAVVLYFSHESSSTVGVKSQGGVGLSSHDTSSVISVSPSAKSLVDTPVEQAVVNKSKASSAPRADAGLPGAIEHPSAPPLNAIRTSGHDTKPEGEAANGNHG